jgi:hypothetical protein
VRTIDKRKLNTKNRTKKTYLVVGCFHAFPVACEQTHTHTHTHLMKESENKKQKKEKVDLLLASCAPSWWPLFLVNTHTQLL